MKPDLLSIVVPVYNEEESLEQLHAELGAVAEREGYRLDIVFVDDGSKDKSWEIIERLAERDARVRGIRFRRNFGKAAALSAGFQAALGDPVMTLDADLQDDPQEIPRFLEQIESGLDVVSGWKEVRHDPWHKVLPSRVFNWMVSRLTGVHLHDHNCGMKCYRREVLGEVQLYGELHRFVPVLASAKGFRSGEISIHHRSRRFGYSKYGVTRFVKGFLDLLSVKFVTGYGQRPLHILGTAGLVSFLLGGLLLAFLAVQWIVTRIDALGLVPVHLHERPLLFYSGMLLLLGAQFMSIGFLAELFIAYHSPDTRSYSISRRTPGFERNERSDA